jgi:predicted DnaQ family exonuclease/DinG family helicase
MPVNPEILKEINFENFVVFDIETTGLDPVNDRIIEIGAIQFKDGKENKILDTLINPGIEIPAHITKLTGITDSDVKNAPQIEDELDKLFDFIGESPIVGHQINFDASFLERQLRNINNDFNNWENEAQRFKYFRNLRLDTLFFCRIFLPFLQRFRLGSVAAYFGIDLENAHRAFDDARATGHIFLELIDRTIATDTQILRTIIRLLYPNSSRVKHFFQPILEFKQRQNIQVTSAGLNEDLKYFQEHYNIIGESNFLPEFSEDEVSNIPIDVDRIAAYLSDSGDLSRAIPNFEQRDQQIEMARQIATTFNDSRFLVVEAGTGTGKSMAYLLPTVEWAVQNRANNERVLISTNTKNLQEQLFLKDLPTVLAVSNQKFKAVLLKGKSNYLCLDKWKLTLTDMDKRLSPQERTRILPLISWAEQTSTGDIAENIGFQLNQNWGLWGKLIAENNYCPGRSCKFYNDCFLMRVRNNARRADIVVVNHSLLFSDLITDNSILGEYHNVIIDEAHNIEKTAGEYLGVRFNWWSFRNIYHKLYEEEPRKAGTLVQLEFRLTQGNQNREDAERLLKHVNRLKTACLEFKRVTNQFFTELNHNLRDRYQNKSKGEFDETKIRYFKNFRYFNDLFDLTEDLKTCIINCKNHIAHILNGFDEIRPDSFQFQDQIHRELISLETDFETLFTSFEFCLMADADDYVYWLELPLRKESTDVSFNAVPLNIAQLLKQTLYDHLKTAMFTSATLAVDTSFEYYNKRIGLDRVEHTQVGELLLGSPFDFANQLLLGIADFIDDPRGDAFPDQLSSIIKEIHYNHPTGLLALFTNYSTLNYLYEQLKTHFEMEKVLLLAQGKSGSRTGIINQFREDRNSILLGTDSFWEGIDVPGDALEMLIITKLPFDVPTEPLIAAKLEKIKQAGGNPFVEYSVPEAIIKFRQGFGRLIRHKNDIGVVLVCDNRLNRMRYGQQFLNSLPVPATVYTERETLYSDLTNWFLQKHKTEAKVNK